jgi:hypothetical protein
MSGKRIDIFLIVFYVTSLATIFVAVLSSVLTSH